MDLNPYVGFEAIQYASVCQSFSKKVFQFDSPKMLMRLKSAYEAISQSFSSAGTDMATKCLCISFAKRTDFESSLMYPSPSSGPNWL